MFKQKRILHTALLALILMFSVLITSCQKQGDVLLYKNYLKQENYEAASNLVDTLEEDVLAQSETLKDIDRSFAAYVLSLQGLVQENELSLQDYSYKLSQMTKFNLSHEEDVLTRAASALNDSEAAIKQIDEAKAYIQQSRFEEALVSLEHAKPLSVLTSENRMLFDSARKSYKQDVLSRVNTLEANGNLAAAVELLDGAMLYIQHDSELAILSSRLKQSVIADEKQALVQTVTNLRAEEAWDAAINAINSASSLLKQDAEITALEKQLERNYQDLLLTQLETLEADGLHEEALLQVQEDLKTFPDSLRLQWKERTYKAIVDRNETVDE